MIFLLDENIAPSQAFAIKQLGHDAIHVRELKLLGKPDEKNFEFAFLNQQIIITHDLDFSRIHALSGRGKPSVILFRAEPLTLDFMIQTLSQHLKLLEDELKKGAFVVIETDQIRVRLLPIKSV
ncbi:MAG: DUF5615 family PIN-like protein [Chitinophagales bacterium]|nr:DUF5615 family PIN-like protein [Chitinophagales bacterium]